MTQAEAKLGTMRLHEIEEKKLLPEETIRFLKKWWCEKLLAGKSGKIIPFPERS